MVMVVMGIFTWEFDWVMHYLFLLFWLCLVQWCFDVAFLVRMKKNICHGISF